jgi:predicted acylesterase/phospholipase RssA
MEKNSRKKDKSIGLALSGGGHRATIFSLGALLYLADSGKNKNVKTITSVSGGSITNAFLSLLPNFCDGKSYCEVDSSTFEPAVAQFSKRIAGSPAFWWTALGLYIATLFGWCVMTVYAFPGSLQWQWQLPFIFPICGCAWIGSKSGGTLWGCWTTWMILGFTIYGFAIGVALLFYTPTLYYGVGCIVVALIVLTQRSWISEAAMGNTICALGGRTTLLNQIANATRHVFCATEIASGEHGYFSHDMIISPSHGIGRPKHLHLSTAVQASANFPIAFPPLPLRWRKYDFVEGMVQTDAHYYKKLLFSDGGIRDNMGVTWYLDAQQQREEFINFLARKKAFQKKHSKFLTKQSKPERLSENDENWLLTQIKARGAEPDQLIVINSSATYTWKKPGQFGIPIWGDVLSLLKLPSIMYNNEGVRQINDLRHRFFSEQGDDGEGTGAVVSIEENPSMVAHYAAGLVDVGPNKIYPCLESIAPRIRDAANQAMQYYQFGPEVESTRPALEEKVKRIELRLKEISKNIHDIEEKKNEYNELATERLSLYKRAAELEKEQRELGWQLTDNKRTLSNPSFPFFWSRIPYGENKDVRTTLMPLGRSVTAKLLMHGYFLTMMNTHIFLDFPLLEIAPTLSNFEKIAEGRLRSN